MLFSLVNSFTWSVNKFFSYLIFLTSASKTDITFSSFCIAWKLWLIVGCWKQCVALAGPGVCDRNISSTDCFLVFWRVTLARASVLPFSLPRNAFIDWFLGVLKFVKEKSESSPFFLTLQLLIFSFPSMFCSSKSLSSSFNYFSLVFFFLNSPFLNYLRAGIWTNILCLPKTQLKREKRHDNNIDNARYSYMIWKD